MKVDLRSRIRGCLFGVAVGDAFGMPASFLPPQEIRKIYGQITKFEAPIPDHIYHAGYKPGQITDDTEQTIAVANALLERNYPDSRKVADNLLAWFEMVTEKHHDAVGPSSKAALMDIKEGKPLIEAGKRGHTNGAAMRISPVGILNACRKNNREAIVRDVYQVCLPTHGSTLGVSGAGALACAIAQALNDSEIDDVISAAIEGARLGENYGFPVIGPSVPRRIELAIDLAKKTSSLEDAASEIYQVIGAGVAIAESVPAAIGLFFAAQGDPKTTILSAVNMGGDSDTIASMAGALAGAFRGIRDFPEPWIETIKQVNDLDLDKLTDDLFNATRWWGQNHPV